MARIWIVFMLFCVMLRPSHQKSSKFFEKPRLFVYDLPGRFNVDNVQCAMRAGAHHGISYGHHGYGSLVSPLAQDKISLFNKPVLQSLLQQETELPIGSPLYNLRETDQFSLEVIFHNKALHSHFRVHDAEEANLFYIPFYSRFIQSCFPQNASAILRSLESELFANLSSSFPFWRRSKGRDHIMALGFIEREHRQHCEWCSGILLRKESDPMMFFAIEREQKRKSTERSNVVVVPYPSAVHHHHLHLAPSDSNVSRVRPILVSCIASDQSLPLRLRLKEQLETDSRGLWLEPIDGPSNQGADALMLVAMEHSVFCLQPPGDSPTRKGFYDSLLLGCIPVRFAKQVKYPFDTEIDYDHMSVRISPSKILDGSLNIVSYLASISSESITAMQKAMAAAAVKVQYSEIGSEAEIHGKDAFDLAIEEVFHSIYKPQRPLRARGEL